MDIFSGNTLLAVPVTNIKLATAAYHALKPFIADSALYNNTC